MSEYAGTVEARYAILKEHGFHIDTRGVLPLLVRGLVVITCKNTEEALTIGLNIIEETK